MKSMYNPYKKPMGAQSNSNDKMFVSNSLKHNAKQEKSTQRVVFDILVYLRALEGKPATLTEIMISSGHVVEGNLELIDALKNNPKVEYVDNCFFFKPVYNVKNSKEILELLAQHPNGLLVSDLAESYTKAQSDIKALKEAKEIYSIKSSEGPTEVIFPNEEKYRMKISQELVEMWKDIKVPNEADLERELREAGLTLVESVESSKTTKSLQKIKKERKRRTTKLTNTHIENFDPNAPITLPPPKDE